jgi:hypothetical protein
MALLLRLVADLEQKHPFTHGCRPRGPWFVNCSSERSLRTAPRAALAEFGVSGPTRGWCCPRAVAFRRVARVARMAASPMNQPRRRGGPRRAFHAQAAVS